MNKKQRDEALETLETLSNNTVTAAAPQKETQMSTRKNSAVGEIKELISDGWIMSDHDMAVIDVVETVPLKDLVAGHTTEIDFGGSKKTVPTLSLLKNKVTLTHPKQVNSAGQKKTTSKHLWENSEWTDVLEAAGPMYLVKKASMKKGKYMLVDVLLDNPEDMEWVVRYPNGNPTEQEGFIIPSVGGFNFRTGQLENVPTEPIVVQKSELFHKWHDGQQRIDAAGKSSKGKTSGAAQIHNRIAKAKADGNTKMVKRLTTLVETMYPNG